MHSIVYTITRVRHVLACLPHAASNRDGCRDFAPRVSPSGLCLQSGSDGDSSIGSDGSNDLGSDSSKAGDSKHALTKGSKGYLGLVATLNSADADEFVKTVCTVAKASDLAVTTEAIQGRSSIGVEEGPDSPRAVEGESSYVIKFTPPRAGLFMLEVVLRGKHILGSPYRIQVIPCMPPRSSTSLRFIPHYRSSHAITLLVYNLQLFLLTSKETLPKHYTH